jgi:hypothetical protein
MTEDTLCQVSVLFQTQRNLGKWYKKQFYSPKESYRRKGWNDAHKFIFCFFILKMGKHASETSVNL